ncbi:hypothetical protein BDA99DRAFT_504690 [Phascolomyces articulosus]|uniref:Uncharacterized protein n=1 Tax=Phascolomyces articulosus TaxID=60185 RepID=A0AAD5PFX1_9FUNG|nr:hypothetical protein BDA99DRAFT_504690 [Phascolomyces articulosus]
MIQTESTATGPWRQCTTTNAMRCDPFLLSETNHFMTGLKDDNSFVVDETMNLDDYKKEMDAFFNYTDLLSTLREYYNAYQTYIETHGGNIDASYIAKMKDEIEKTKSDTDRLIIVQSIAYITLGSFCEGENVLKSERKFMEGMVINNNRWIRDSGLVQRLFKILFDEAHSISNSNYNHNNTFLKNIHEKLIDTYLTILYLSIITHDHRNRTLKKSSDMPWMNEGDDTPAQLIKIIAINKKTKETPFHTKKFFLLLYRVLVMHFGNTDQANSIKNQVRSCYDLPPVDNNKLFKTTPIDLYAFHCEIRNKYIDYQLPNHQFSITDTSLAAATATTTTITDENDTTSLPMETIFGSNTIPAFQHDFPPKPASKPKSATTTTTSSPSSSSSLSKDDTPSAIEFKKQLEKTQSSTPFAMGTPKAIEEAGQLYNSYMDMSVSQYQIIQEREKLFQQTRSNSVVQYDSLKKVDNFYALVVQDLPVVVNVLLEQLLTLAPTIESPTFESTGRGMEPVDDHEHADAVRNREIIRATVSSLLLLLLKWFKASHVMKFEYLSQLLADSGYLMLSVRSLMIEDLKTIFRTKSHNEAYGFFSQLVHMNFNEEGTFSSSTCSSSSSFSISYSWDQSPPESPCIDDIDDDMTCNQLNRIWVLDTLRILQMMTKGKPLRNRILAQYNARIPLKRIAKHNNDSIEELYALKLLKSQVRYLGLKWRTNNMKTVSAISRRCPMNLRDDWLSLCDNNGDNNNNNNNELNSEANLRLLVKLYHEQFYDINTFTSNYDHEDDENTIGSDGNHCNGDYDKNDDDDDEMTINRWTIGTQESPTFDYTSSYKLTRQINELFKQPLKRRLKAKERQVIVEADGWDMPSPFVNADGNSFASNKNEMEYDDDDDVDTDYDEEEDQEANKKKEDPLQNIDWNNLTEDELNARMNLVEEQTEQRWLSVDLDDPAYIKVLNALEIDDGEDTPVVDEYEENPWL